MSSLQSMPNIGKVAEALLAEAGITTPEMLIKTGSKEAFIKIRLIDPTVCLHMLYGLEGAVEGIRDSMLSTETKRELTAFFKSL